MSDVAVHLLLPLTTDLCKDSYRVNKPPGQEAIPMDGVHFNGVLHLPPRHIALSWNIHFCNAQTFSSLAPSNAMQAIGSDAEISTTVTTSPPFGAIWRIDGIVVGTASVNSAGTLTAGAVTTGTIYERVFTKCKYLYSAGSYTSNQYTTVLTIQGLLASEDGVTVDVGTPGIYDTSLNLNVQECSLDTTTYPSLNFTCDDSPCEFNSAGTLSCAEGYTGSDVAQPQPLARLMQC
ncbi:unnamed protein product [Clavelina lepadiformis]|uniref:Uncharacterized protein n=1 Tax=Clavelina lepadiformis TaxID=159417 RepID=A0ABP0FGC7_CLALP